MLVLSRRLGERIVIGADVEVVVVAVGPRRVKLGIHAPPEKPIYRAELLQRISRTPAALCPETPEQPLPSSFRVDPPGSPADGNPQILSG